MAIDIGRSVTYPFEDQGWSRKLIVLLILSFIPGMNVIAWGGYALSVARNILRREALPLPTWESWSDIIVRGLLSITASALYFSPLLILLIGFAFLSLVFGQRGDTFFNAIRCIGPIGAVIYLVLANFVLNAGHIRYALTDQYHAYFDFGARLHDIRRHSSLFLALFLYESVLSLIMVGLLLIGIGAITLGASLVVSSGTVASLLVIPIVLLVLVGLLAMTTLAFLANGYFLGAFTVMLLRANTQRHT